MTAITIPAAVFRRSHEHGLVDVLEEQRERFDDEYVVRFINAFSVCEGDAAMWLEDRGIGENYGKSLIDAELMRELCRAWVRSPQVLYGVAGTLFWSCMRELASTAYDAE